MNILLLTQWFDPEPVFKGLSFARELQSRGHAVQVLTGLPNYPTGRLYQGYRSRLWQRESLSGIPVNRVWLYPSHDRSAGRRILNYCSFAVAAAAVGPLVLSRPDVIYAYHPPGTIALPARLIAKRFRSPVVYDVQDLWPDTIATSGMMRAPGLIKVADFLSKAAYRSMEQVTTLSPGMKRVLVERGVPAERTTVVYNWAEERAISVGEVNPAAKEALGLAGRFVVMFAGTLGLSQGLETVLAAARQCVGRVPQATFVLVGGGVDQERLAKIAERERLTNVKFLAHQPIEAVGPLLAMADILLVHLRDEPLFRVTIPSKTQAYLAAGKPIIMAVRGDAADLISAAQSGLVCAPGDPEALADTVARAAATAPDELKAMGLRGRNFYDRELSLAVGVSKFEQVFHRVAGLSRGKRSPGTSSRDGADRRGEPDAD